MFKYFSFCFCFCSFISFYSFKAQAFISEILEAKKKVESSFTTLETITDTLEDLESITKIEKEYSTYEKELREFQKTLDEYERLGLDVKDFTEIRAYDPSSLRGQIDFFKNYFKRANNLIKSFQSLMQSPESLTASEQIETNRTLRALLEDSQTKELRRLRAEIAKEKILLERRKKEQEFLSKQYAYINRHSKRKGFGVFHPFQNSQDNTNKKNNKRKKFLGIFKRGLDD